MPGPITGGSSALITATSIALSGLTSGRVPYVTTSGLITDGQYMTYSPTGGLVISNPADTQASLTFGVGNVTSSIMNAPSNMYINSNSGGTQGAPRVIEFGFNRTAYTGGTPVLRILQTGEIKFQASATVGFTGTVPAAALDTILSRNAAGVFQFGTTAANASGAAMGTFIAAGTAPTCTGATIGTGSKNNAGFVTASTTGVTTCVVTFSVTAPTGWAISPQNNTTANLIRQTASSTTTATFVGTTVSGDVISFVAMPY